MNLFDVLFAKKLGGGSPFPPVIKRVTGNPIEFSDGADAPLVKCTTTIQGYQDLHGYDKPWVGGAGKNKLPLVLADIKNIQSHATSEGSWSGDSYVTNGVTFKINTDNAGNVTSILATGSTTSDNATLVLYGTNVTSAKDIVFSQPFIVSDGANGSATTFRGIVWGTEGAFIDAEEVSFNAMTVYGFGIRISADYTLPSGGVMFYPMIRLSTESDPTFAPYSNICPITAYTEGKIEVSDGDGNTTTHTATFSNSIYQGNADFVGSGVTGDMPLVDFDNLTENLRYDGTTNKTISFTMPYAYKHAQGLTLNCLSENYKYIGQVSSYGLLDNPDSRTVGVYSYYTIAGGTSTTIYIVTPKSVSSYGKFAYKVNTPITEDITPTNLPIKSLFGYNHIESSTGEMTIDYITDAYQNFVDTVESALPSNTRNLLTASKGGVKAFDIFKTLDEPKTPEAPAEESKPEEKETEEGAKK